MKKTTTSTARSSRARRYSIAEVSEEVGLSKGRISQIINGYSRLAKDGTAKEFPALLQEDLHFFRERSRAQERVYITTSGIKELRKIRDSRSG
jgi:transcriptional regulator with XRE-family HTH domain